MKRMVRIWKVFTSSRKVMVSIVLVGLLLGLIPNFTQLVFLSSENELMRSEKKEYGSFGTYVINCTDEDYKKLEAYPNVDRIKKTEQYTVSINDEKYYYYDYAKEFDLDLMGIKLIKGKLPTANGQLVLDEKYIAEYGYDYSVIGKKISLPVSDKKKKSFVITGIISQNSVWDDSTGEYIFLAYKENANYNCAYASFLDYSHLDADYKELTQKLDGKVCPNLNMYLNLGYGYGGLSVFQQYDIIYAGVFLFMLLGMCFVVYNIAKTCMYDARESIGVMNLIGIRKNTIIVSFVSVILVWVLVGILSGLLLSSGIIAAIHVGLYHTLSYYFSLWTGYPITKMLFTISFCLLINVLVLLPLLICIKRMSPNELLRQESIFEKRKSKKGKRVFKKRTRLVCLKLAGNDLRYDKFMNIISVFGIALGTVIITTAIFYMKTNFSTISGNYKYQYMVDLNKKVYGDDNYDTMVENLYKKNYGFSDSVQTHSVFSYYTDIAVSKEKLSRQYLNYLSQDAENYKRILRNQDVIVSVHILGYDDTELERLYEMNHMKYKKIVDKEAIVLDYLYSTNIESRDFHAPFNKEDKIVFTQENENKNLKVKNKVRKLTVYPEVDDLSIVIIVNLDTFQKLTPFILPTNVYVDEITEKKDLQNLELLKSNRQFSVSSPAEEKAELVRFNRIIHMFVYIIFSICIGVAILLLYSSYYLKIYINKKEYAMLHTIGINTGKIQRIVLLEMFLSYLFGTIISFLVSYTLTKKIYLVKYPHIGNYLYQFPLQTYGVSCLVSMVISGIVWYYVLKKLKTVLNVHVLWSL